MTSNGGEGVNEMNEMTEYELLKMTRELFANKGAQFGRAVSNQGYDVFTAHDLARLFCPLDPDEADAFLYGVTQAYLARA
jgi:hypothetical protein